MYSNHVIQERLPPGATVTPVILASDKTKLTQFRGDATAWPVYLSIGNISKATRRKLSSRSMVLVGYLPIPKLDGFSTEALQSSASYDVFHYCMKRILEPLVEAGKNGVDMVCPDGWVRKVFPVLAVYICDHPERCLVACTKENRCPVCLVSPERSGEMLGESHRRESKRTLKIIEQKLSGRKVKAYNTEGLRAVGDPFWKDLPHADIFQCFAPDFLHQLHKGVFKDHILNWCQAIVGKDEVDDRFRAMTSHPDLRHFANGISAVSQWTGHECKEMEKVFLPLLAGAADPSVVQAVRAMLDVIYLAQLETHTTKTLQALHQALDEFHSLKDVFVKLKVRDHFNFPKLHSLQHYDEWIMALGSGDGYSTELPERLHIDYAKKAYRASNRKEYVEQMTRWLTRQESIIRFDSYLAWRGLLGDGMDAEELFDSEVDWDDEVATIEKTHIASRGRRSPRRLDARLLLPKTPSKSRVTAAFIERSYGAPDFLPCLAQYLQRVCPLSRANAIIWPNAGDRFDIYHLLRIVLPDHAFLDPLEESDRTDRVRCAPSRPGRPGHDPQPACFDTVLVQGDSDNRSTVGTPWEGASSGLCSLACSTHSHAVGRASCRASTGYLRPSVEPLHSWS